MARFLDSEASGAIVLSAATIIALVIANGPSAAAFAEFWHIEAGFMVGGLEFMQSLAHWVDDALMALFFFVIGLEIKREFIVGELSTFRGAALPVVAALGGMIVPAAVYLTLNMGSAVAGGWGVPMATDIAFALGVLALLGSRIPTGLKVFLSALAIADDLGAIIVIAVFYTQDIKTTWLMLALVPLAGLIVMNRLRVSEPIAYLAVGTVLWFCILNSGVHATIAGVIAALTVPAVGRMTPTQFTDVCRVTIDEIDTIDVPGAHTLEDDSQQRLALGLSRVALLSAAPLQRLEFALLPFTTFVVLPLFALVNAGVTVEPTAGQPSSLFIGIVLGLVLGKPLGITLASWLAVKLGLGRLSPGVTWRHVIGAGLLGGIGFTMSMFVANLAFQSAEQIAEAKVAILVASLIAGSLGYVWLRFMTGPGPGKAPQ